MSGAHNLDRPRTRPKRRSSGAFRPYLLPYERARLEDLESQMDAIAKEAAQIANRGNSRRRHALGLSTSARASKARKALTAQGDVGGDHG